MKFIGGSWDPASISALAAIFRFAYRRVGIECQHLDHAKTPGRRDIIPAPIDQRQQALGIDIADARKCLPPFVDLPAKSACDRHFATICTFRIAPRPGRKRDSTGGATRKIRRDAGAITQQAKRLHRFLSYGCGGSVHVVENKANRMANFLLDFESQRA